MSHLERIRLLETRENNYCGLEATQHRSSSADTMRACDAPFPCIYVYYVLCYLGLTQYIIVSTECRRAKANAQSNIGTKKITSG